MSLLLNGTNQRLYRHASLPTAASFTIMGWVWAVAWGTDLTMFGLGTLAGGTARYNAQLDAVSGNKIKIWNGLADALGASVLSTATWYHIAMVGNGTDVRLYLNGVLEATAGLNAHTPATLYVGGTETTAAGWSEHSNIRISQARVYDAALTAAEILTERASFSEVRTTNINLDTPMTGATLALCLVDASGLAHDWSQDFTPTVDPDPPPVGASTPPMFRGV